MIARNSSETIPAEARAKTFHFLCTMGKDNMYTKGDTHLAEFQSRSVCVIYMEFCGKDSNIKSE